MDSGDKKRYEAPAVKKVRLEVKESILAVCHSSADQTPQAGEIACSAATGCYYPPTP